jgi:hypothetical protein
MTTTRTRQSNLGVCLYCLLVSLVAPSKAAAQSRTDRDVCPEIVTTLVPQRVFKVPTKLLQRVEIRTCMPGETENLQFVAWKNGATKPSLVLTTSDETVVQLAMSGGVFAIETSGGAHYYLFVIVYDGGASFRDGKPRLALQAVTKGPVFIQTSEDRVTGDYRTLGGSADMSCIQPGLNRNSGEPGRRDVHL